MIQVTKEFTFDSAHFLPNYYGKCESMHGHTYKLHVTVEGELGENGLLIDFVVLKRIVKKQVLERLDHKIINDTIQVASCEKTAQWIWDQLVDLKSLIAKELGDPNLPASITKYFAEAVPASGVAGDATIDISDFSNQVRLKEIRLWETPTSFVTYSG